MTQGGIELNKEWEKWEKLVNAGRFRQRLALGVKTSMTKACVMLKGKIKRRIKAKDYAKNAPLTVAVKGSSTPLVNDSDLWRAIAYRTYEGGFKAFVGILRTTKRGANGKDLINVAETLHDGRTIQVTQRMRGYFARMARKHPGVWRPLSPATNTIKIVARKFIEDPATEFDTVAEIQMLWREGVRYGLTGESVILGLKAV